MNVTWLGQAGFLLEKNGKKILIDPYLSDSCGKANSNSRRRTALDVSFLSVKPDVIILTHEHADPTDLETLEHYLPGAGNVLVLAGANAWNKVRALGGNNNYVRFCPGSRWTWEEFTFTAVRAAHSDPQAIGVVVDDSCRKYYFTGDTLYHEDIFPALPADLWAVFLPINGRGNNMNAADAADFARRTGAKCSVPVHYGMFDEIDPAVFSAENRILLKPYQRIRWEEEK